MSLYNFNYVVSFVSACVLIQCTYTSQSSLPSNMSLVHLKSEARRDETVVDDYHGTKKITKIVIFGSTGMAGLCAVEAAIKKGLQVRAFVRDPAKIPDHLKDKVEAVQGDVLEPDSVANAVEGTNGVVVTLGTRNSLEPTTVLSEGLKNILDAMKAKNVKTVTVCLSAFLFYEPEDVPEPYGPVTDDHRRMYEALKESGLNWVAVFPPQILEEPSREMTVMINPQKSPDGTITKWDLGTFMIDALFGSKCYKAVIGLINVPK